MQHNKTRIPKSESISPEYRQFFPAGMLFRPARILSILAVWAGLMLGISLQGMAAGRPDGAGAGMPGVGVGMPDGVGAGMPGRAGAPRVGTSAFWDIYQVTILPQNNNAIAGSGVNDVVRVLVMDLTTGLPAVGFPLSFTIVGTTVSSTPVTNGSGYYDYGLASGAVGSADILIQTNGQSFIQTFTYVAGPPAVNPPPGSVNPSYFIVTQNNATADGSSQDIVEIHLSNQFGVNEPPGTLVTLTVTSISPASSNALLNGTTTTTITVPLGANGIVDIPITDVTIGNVTLQATVPGNPTPIGGPGYTQVINFVTGVPDVSNPQTMLVVDVLSTAADGTSQDKIHAHLVDSKGRILINQTVTIDFLFSPAGPIDGTAGLTVTNPGGGSGGGPYTVTTDANGDVYLTITNTQIGTVSLGATVNGKTITNGSPAAVQFVTGPPDASQSSLVVDIPSTAADGTSQDQIHAHLLDSKGRVIANQAVTIVFYIVSTGDPAEATVTPITVSTTTDANGNIYLKVSDVTVGTVLWGAKVNASGDDITNGKPAATKFVVGPVDKSRSYITVTQDGATANGVAQDVVTAYLFDAQGRAITDGTTVTFSIQGTGVATIKNSASQGVTTGSVFAQYVSMVVGKVQIQASYTAPDGTTVYLTDQNNSSNSYVTIHFVVGTPVPGNPGGGGSGGGNPGGGGVPPGGGSGGGSGGGGSGGGSGGGTVGGGTGSNSGYTILFVTQDFRLADGKQQDSVYAYITDANKHPVPGASVKFFIQNTPTSGTATASAQLVGQPDETTNGSGIAGIAVTSTKPGTVYVDAILTVNGTSVLIDGSYQIVTFLTAPDLNNPLTALSVVVYEALADGSQQTAVKAHIVDLDGNVMPDQNVTFTIDSGNAQILTPQPVQTDANGDAYIYITSKTPGYVLITATINGQKIVFGSPARVKFASINIYVPKVFTPNNDGTNDVLKPILVGISTFHYFSIYNRWGNLIYTTQDPNRGWDGTFKGVAQPVETYLWMAEGIDVEGKKIVQKGMVSLVR